MLVGFTTRALCDSIIIKSSVFFNLCLFVQSDDVHRDFSLTWGDFIGDKRKCMKLSSAGLIYAHYGKRVISALTGLDADNDALEKIYLKVSPFPACHFGVAVRYVHGGGGLS